MTNNLISRNYDILDGMKVCETFRSIQGEGKKIGAVTYFIRAAGCNLDCSWCDSRYAAEDCDDERTVDELLELTKDDLNVCITGGEPLLQKDLPELLKRLSSAGKTVVVETNGSLDISVIPDSDNIIISMDIKCPSSKMHEKMNFDNIELLRPKDQLNFIIFDGIDLDYAVAVMEKYTPNTEVVFTAVGGMDLEPLAEEAIDRKLNVRVLPQLNKVIWGNKRTV